MKTILIIVASIIVLKVIGEQECQHLSSSDKSIENKLHKLEEQLSTKLDKIEKRLYKLEDQFNIKQEERTQKPKRDYVNLKNN